MSFPYITKSSIPILKYIVILQDFRSRNVFYYHQVAKEAEVGPLFPIPY